MHLLRQALAYYIDSFRGFSKEVWWLSLATLINRSGAMVLPFLSLYLIHGLNFTLKDVGWVMTFFGLGSFAGAWLGGELTQRYGAYRTMVFSLVMSGICFVILGRFTHFWTVCGGMFFTALVSDTFRPAVFVSIAAYARPENRTRAITLIRLAINLGFSLGPALGGLIIVHISYGSLFWIDGITCVIAGFIILMALVEKRTSQKHKNETASRSNIRILSDVRYLVFLLALFLFGVTFIQYFSTIPVYYKSDRLLTEDEVGWLFSLNGGLIFLFEMPLIYALERPSFDRFKIITGSAWLMAMSFIILFFRGWSGVLIIGMVLATLSEMLCLPFTNSYAMQRGGSGNEGRYMAYYSMAFSLAHIVGHNWGM